MLRFEYHPGLIEQATFLAARRDRATEHALRAELDAVYSIVDPNLRDEHFAQIHGRWFVELKLDRPVRTLVAEQPLIGQRVGCCHVREAAGRRRENVELFVRTISGEGSGVVRTLIIDLCPEALLDTDRLSAWLRRELLKVSDMLDDAFGYSPILPDVHRARQNLIRDRYRVLWDAYVEARLRCKHADAVDPSGHLRERFARAFSHGGALSTAASVDMLLQLTSTTHHRLLEWALQPQTMPGWSVVASDPAYTPGELCPLCRFPTYDWYDFKRHDGGVIIAIRQAFANWTVQTGACRQCVETLAAARGDLTETGSSTTLAPGPS